jgi:hypothetical protein
MPNKYTCKVGLNLGSFEDTFVYLAVFPAVMPEHSLEQVEQFSVERRAFR